IIKLTANNQTPATVIARKIFYNHSNFDGNNAAANSSDDGAIATDKQALLPGGVATFANYTSYSNGINGIMIDVQNLGTTSLTSSDFVFRVGNSDSQSNWTTPVMPSTILVRPIGGSTSNRVELTWADGAIKKQWLQVTMLGNTDTGLLTDDVFYFGNAI